MQTPDPKGLGVFLRPAFLIPVMCGRACMGVRGYLAFQPPVKNCLTVQGMSI